MAAQDIGTFMPRAIAAWELGVTELKRTGLPELGMTLGAWFQQALRTTRAKLTTIMPVIAIEAAAVPAIYSRE